MTPSNKTRQPLRFTIRGLLILTLGLAVGAADQNWRQGAWTDRTRSLLLVVSVWIVVGLLQQALRAARATHLAGSRPCMSDVWEVLRPFGLAAILVFYHVIEHFDARKLAAMNLGRIEHRWWIDVVYCLAMAAVLIEVIQRTHAPPSRLPPFFFLPAWALGIVFATLACYERTVQLAGASAHAAGITESVSRSGLRLESLDVGHSSFWLGLSLAVFVPAAVASLYFVARGSRKRYRRIGYAAVFAAAIIGLAGSLSINASLARFAVESFTRGDEGREALKHLARIIVPGGLVLLAALAANWARFWMPEALSKNTSQQLASNAEAARDPALHWHPLVLALLTAAIAVEVAFVALRTSINLSKAGSLEAGSLLAVLFTYESTLLMAALGGLAAAAAWRARLGVHEDRELPPLPASRLAFFAGAAATVSALAVGVLALYGLALRIAS